MDNYVEKNLRDIAKVKISTAFDNKLSKKDDEKLAYSKDVLELITNIESNEFKPLSLNKILTNNIELSNDKDIEILYN